jgi:hypothetical protein
MLGIVFTFTSLKHGVPSELLLFADYEKSYTYAFQLPYCKIV